jgi:hypothetical protein
MKTTSNFLMTLVMGLAFANAYGQSSNLTTFPSVLASGGGAAFCGNYSFTHTVGEALVGTSGGESYVLVAGFCATQQEEAVHLVTKPRLQLKHRSGRSTVSIETETQINYIIEYTDSLITQSWKALTRVEGTGQTVVVTDDANNAMRFYRIRIE